MRDEHLPFNRPFIGEEEIDEVVQTLRSGWLTTGPRARRFEERFAARLGAPGALALNSCTAALHTALIALGIGPGDEVITTPFTFVASVNVIEHTGAHPVLIDVEHDTLNIDPRLVERAVTPRTRAIIPVHYAGHPVEMDPLLELAGHRNLAVVEDAAHAFPAAYRGVPVGSRKNPAAFSFYPTKNLTTGEGGMLTGDTDFLERARTISLHGLSRDAWRRYEKGGSWYYEVLLPGFKYNMPDILAALGLEQLSRIDEFQERRRAVVRAYTEAFSACTALETPIERPHVEHAWHLYVLRLREEALTIDRNRFIEELAARNIDVSVHFIPVHLHPYYSRKYGFRPEDFPVAYANYRRVISLPLYPGLQDRDVADVIEAVLDIARLYRR